MPTVVNETIAFQRLRSSIEWFDAPIQFYEASTKLVQQKCDAEPNKKTTICDVFNVGLGITSSNRLNHPISYYSKFKKYSVRILYNVAICHLYDIYTNYLRMLVEEMQSHSEARILGSPYARKRFIKIYYQDIVSEGDFAKVVAKAGNDFFKSIQNIERHKDLLGEIAKISGIHYDNTLWKEVNFYMQYRNQLVHNYGKANGVFVMNYKMRFSPPITIGTELPLDKRTYKNACMAIIKFCSDLDQKLIAASYVATRP